MIPRRRNTPIEGIARTMLGALGSGEETLSALEETFRQRFDLPYAIATSSGRQAMVLALEALELSPGDEVVFPALTFYVLPELVRRMGLRPVFVNCGEDFNIRMEELSSLRSTRIRAVIATHLFGTGCDMSALCRWARRRGVVVIEDCAHALGVSRGDRLLGTMGEVAFFSFQNRKPINALGGGVLVTKNHKIFRHARRRVRARHATAAALPFRVMLNYAELALTNRYLYRFIHQALYNTAWSGRLGHVYQSLHHRNVDTRSGFTAPQALLARQQLAGIEVTNQRRVDLARLYISRLQDLDDIALPRLAPGQHNFYGFITRCARARALQRYLAGRGVDVGIGEQIVRSCGRPAGAHGPFGATARLLERMVELPMYLQLSEGEVEYICGAIREFYQTGSHKDRDGRGRECVSAG